MSPTELVVPHLTMQLVISSTTQYVGTDIMVIALAIGTRSAEAGFPRMHSGRNK